MNKKSKTTIFILSVITLILLILVVLSGNPDRRVNGIYKIIGAPVSAMQSGFSKVGNKLNSWFNVVSSYDEIEKEMDALRSENMKLHEYKDEYERLSAENEELREMISLKKNTKDHNLVAVNIIAGDVTDWFNYFTIDCGTADGIYKNCPVITVDGLVGIVSEVGINSAKVMTIIDEQNTLMCRLERNNALVRVKGVSAENMKFELFLDRISDDSSLFVGDKLVTASSGDVFPEGIDVGTVREIFTDSKTGERTAKIDIAVKLNGLTTVYVMTKNDSANSSGGESAN